MKIYKRDYHQITEEERELWERVKRDEIWGRDGEDFRITVNKWSEYPKAVRHWLSLFPNHFLDPIDLKQNEKQINSMLYQVTSLLDENSTNEQTILRFIREQKPILSLGLYSTIFHLEIMKDIFSLNFN